MTRDKENDRGDRQLPEGEAGGVAELLRKLAPEAMKPSPLEIFRRCVDAVGRLRQEGRLAVMFRPVGARVGLAGVAARREYIQGLGVEPDQLGDILHGEIVRIAGYLIAGEEPDPEGWFGKLDDEAKREWTEKVAYVRESLLDEALMASFRVNTQTCMPLLDEVRCQMITEDPAWRGGPVRTVLVEVVATVATGVDPEGRKEVLRVECGQEELRFMIRSLQDALERIVPSAGSSS
jgi:hypothetical protein